MKDIYNQLKSRLSNPFLFSFIVSWLFFNWEITIGLIWHSADNIQKLGYQNYSELISDNTKWQNNYLWPMIFAIAFTVGFPFLKWRINSFHAWIDKKEQDNVLKITGNGKVSINKYLELSRNHQEQLNKLSELIEHEEEKAKEFNSKVNERDKKIRLLETEKTNLLALTDVKALDGKWEIGHFGTITGESDTDIVVAIDDGEYQIFHKEKLVGNGILLEFVFSAKADRFYLKSKIEKSTGESHSDYLDYLLKILEDPSGEIFSANLNEEKNSITRFNVSKSPLFFTKIVEEK